MRGADEGAALDAPGHADAADRAAIAAPSVLEGAALYVHDSVAVLVEHADRRPAQIGPAPFAAVADERRVDDLQLPATGEDRATTAAVVPLARGVATSERQVADDESRVGLVVAVRRGPGLLRVARVLVEDAALAHPAQGHQSATVDHHSTGGVDHLRGPPHLDGHRARAAVEPDHPPRRTARTTAAEVQLALDPSPTIRTSDSATRLCGSSYREAADDHVGVAPTAARAVRTATQKRSTQRW